MIIKNKIRIGILTDSFINWSGGVEFLKYVLLGLNRNPDFDLQLLIPDRNTRNVVFKNKVKAVLNSIFKKKFVLDIYPPVNETGAYLSAYLEVESYKTYKTRSQLCALINSDFDLVLPAFYPFNNNINIPIIGYLYDLQHKYYPEFFLKKILAQREIHFAQHLKNTTNIIVNAKTVKNDIAKFYRQAENVHVIPFTPVFDLKMYKSRPSFNDIKEKYNLKTNKPYFIVCNQFWKHKGHLIAVEALLLGIKEFNLNCDLIFTGRFPDPKNFDYCSQIENFVSDNNLTDHVKFLGFVEKADQLTLILNSCAVIQPTRFEGGPGGFIVFEAMAYHKRSIVSDIEVNKELPEGPLISFFRADDPRKLALKMAEHMTFADEPVTVEALRDNFENNRLKLEGFWTDLIKKALMPK